MFCSFLFFWSFCFSQIEKKLCDVRFEVVLTSSRPDFNLKESEVSRSEDANVLNFPFFPIELDDSIKVIDEYLQTRINLANPKLCEMLNDSLITSFEYFFIVDEKGKTKNLTNSCADLKTQLICNELEEIIVIMKWFPAESNGKKLATDCHLQVKIWLEN